MHGIQCQFNAKRSTAYGILLSGYYVCIGQVMFIDVRRLASVILLKSFYTNSNTMLIAMGSWPGPCPSNSNLGLDLALARSYLVPS